MCRLRLSFSSDKFSIIFFDFFFKLLLLRIFLFVAFLLTCQIESPLYALPFFSSLHFFHFILCWYEAMLIKFVFCFTHLVFFFIIRSLVYSSEIIVSN